MISGVLIFFGCFLMISGLVTLILWLEKKEQCADESNDRCCCHHHDKE